MQFTQWKKISMTYYAILKLTVTLAEQFDV
jgi:hypothetical protein